MLCEAPEWAAATRWGVEMAEAARRQVRRRVGRALGLGRDLGVGVTRGVVVGLPVAVGVTVGVVVGVTVGEPVAVGCRTRRWTRLRAVSPAAVPTTAPDDHFMASPDCRVSGSRIRRIGEVGRCPLIRYWSIPATAC